MAVEVEGESPEGKAGGEDVGVSEGGLREPDGVDGGKDDESDGGGEGEERASELVDGEEGGGGDHADESAGSAHDVAGEMPPGREDDGGEGRVSVSESGLRDERAGAVEVPCGGDVVAGLVPEVGEAEESVVGEVDGDEEEGKEHPEGDVGGGVAAAGREEAGFQHEPMS